MQRVISYGDNDIGGEGTRDRVTEETVRWVSLAKADLSTCECRRFTEAFGPLNKAYSIRGIQLIQVGLGITPRPLDSQERALCS